MTRSRLDQSLDHLYAARDKLYEIQVQLDDAQALGVDTATIRQLAGNEIRAARKGIDTIIKQVEEEVSGGRSG